MWPVQPPRRDRSGLWRRPLQAHDSILRLCLTVACYAALPSLPSALLSNQARLGSAADVALEPSLDRVVLDAEASGIAGLRPLTSRHAVRQCACATASGRPTRAQGEAIASAPHHDRARSPAGGSSAFVGLGFPPCALASTAPAGVREPRTPHLLARLQTRCVLGDHARKCAHGTGLWHRHQCLAGVLASHLLRSAGMRATRGERPSTPCFFAGPADVYPSGAPAGACCFHISTTSECWSTTSTEGDLGMFPVDCCVRLGSSLRSTRTIVSKGCLRLDSPLHLFSDLPDHLAPPCTAQFEPPPFRAFRTARRATCA
jgi:hypothetical protein